MRLKDLTAKDVEFVYKVKNLPEIKLISHNRSESKVIIHKNKRVGYIQRYNNIISIALLPKYQGQGIGNKALKKFCRKGDIAEIFWGNMQSIRAFKNAGFKLKFLTYEA